MSPETMSQSALNILRRRTRHPNRSILTSLSAPSIRKSIWAGTPTASIGKTTDASTSDITTRRKSRTVQGSWK